MSEVTIERQGSRRTASAHIAMLCFIALISGSFSFGHMAAPFVEPDALNAIRFFCAFILMMAFGMVKYRSIPIVTAAPWRFVILGGLSAAYFITMFIALQFTSPVSTSAVFTLVPLFSTGFGWVFLRQVSGFRIWLGLLIAACGALWIIFKGDLNALLSFKIGRGELIFFLGCVAYAAYAPLIRRLNQDEDTYSFTVTTLLACLLITATIGASNILDIKWADIPEIVWFVIGYLAVFTTAITFLLLQYASLILPASKVLSYGYLIPVFVVTYEGLLGNGWPSLSIMMGIALTIIALFWTMIFAE
jgi:drug/metabolite transporter (DMT)-like permease